MAIADLLRARGLSPKKRFGQNFLADPHAARTIAEAATTPPGGTVLEIGPGLGALTRPLLERAARVGYRARSRPGAHPGRRASRRGGRRHADSRRSRRARRGLGSGARRRPA